MATLWTVWTDAGKEDKIFGYYPIAKDLSTEDASRMVEILKANGWDASRSRQN